MAMLTVNGAVIPAPSEMKATVFDVSSGVNRNAAGGAVVDRIAVKHRLELKWAYLPGADLSNLLQAMDGFFDISYPDPRSGEMRSMTCYCSDRSAEVLRMVNGEPMWTQVQMTWTER